MTSLMQKYCLIVQDFATSQVYEKWSKTPSDFIIGGAFYMFYTFAGMTSDTLNAKRCNFITL